MFNPFLDVFDLWRRQAQLAGGLAAMGPSASFVVATRVARLAAESGFPTAAGRREAERMVAEKFAAAVEGGFAASRELIGLAGAAGPVAAAAVVMSASEAAMKPTARRLKANARRLSRV